MSGRKGEFASKDLFEQMEKQKDPAYRKEHREPQYLWAALGISFLGGICGGLIFFAARWWLSVFSVLFFLLNGLGAYTFTDVFLGKGKRNGRQIWMILISDVLSVIVTLASVYLLIPDYAEERINKGHSALTALYHYLFTDGLSVYIWVEGILLAFLGTLIGYFLCRKTKGKK